MATFLSISLSEEALFRSYPFASDIPVKTLDEFKELIKGNTYTVTFATGTWCLGPR